MNPQTTQVDDLHLVALPSAVNCTELFVRFSLTEWSLRGLADEAAQAASQLVKPAVDKADPQSPGLLTVRVRLRGDQLVIELQDEHDAGNPVPEIDGARTGVEPLQGGGRMIWCEIPLPAGVTASAVPLPRRERRRSPAAEALPDDATEVDPQVMQRLLSGLGGAVDGANPGADGNPFAR